MKNENVLDEKEMIKSCKFMVLFRLKFPFTTKCSPSQPLSQYSLRKKYITYLDHYKL